MPFWRTQGKAGQGKAARHAACVAACAEALGTFGDAVLQRLRQRQARAGSDRAAGAPSLRSVHSAEGGAPITVRTERLRAQRSESDAVNSGCAQIRAAGYPDEGEELGPYLRPIPERNPHGMVSCL